MPGKPGAVTMATLLERMGRTADDLAVAIQGATGPALARRPDDRSWAAVEVLCHLRDIGETFLLRIRAILAAETQWFFPVEPDRWAADRQYLRNDAGEALAAFRRRREETLTLLRGLTPEQWEQWGKHAERGPMTIRDVVALLASEDDNHLDQLRRALAGRP
jgi:hypothetical protein